MIKLGVTGAIGSGKSVVCKIFEFMGIPVFHADHEGRRLLADDKAIQEKVISLFGAAVLTNKQLDRKKIADIVFNDEAKLKELNSIIHPAVRKSFADWVSKQDFPLIIEEVAILFETGGDKLVDKTLVVTAPEDIRIKRAMERDGISEKEVRQRMNRQWSQEEKAAKADMVFVNDDKTLIIPQVLAKYKELTF
jgi:dephospho-CoA kinase